MISWLEITSEADPDPDPGWKKNQDSNLGRISPWAFFRQFTNSLWVKNTCILLCGSGSGILELFDPGSGIRDGKIQIRDPVKTYRVRNNTVKWKQHYIQSPINQCLMNESIKKIRGQKNILSFITRNRVADPDPVPFWPLDPGSRMSK